MGDSQDPREALEALVEQMDCILRPHKSLPLTKTDHDKTLLERPIGATDRQIDALVYPLYGLTDDEVRIVEGSP